MVKSRRIESLFLEKNRFKKFSREASGIFLDFSKTNIDNVQLDLLMKLLSNSSFSTARENLFEGRKINYTEGKPALHTSIRSPLQPILVGNKNVAEELLAEQKKMIEFCERVQSGSIVSATGKRFTDVVNIGIGGSQLGPEMVINALKTSKDLINIHFLSNIDPSNLIDVLDNLNPETTLFVVVSKSFNTLETLKNATSVEKWLREHLKSGVSVQKHFVAVLSDTHKIENFSFQFGYKFKIHDFIGGRYSFWGVAGISIMLGLGVDNFNKILAGGASMDRHFRHSEVDKNLPALLGLIGVWHSSFCNYTNLAIIPYESRLEFFPRYIQQLQMESNGKNSSRYSETVSGLMSPVVWGDIGTNSQHSFFQYLHQGTHTVPIEFIVGRSSFVGLDEEHHDLLKLNCVAQSEALMSGNSDNEESSPMSIEGNKPSITLIYDKLDPFTLGALVALYEHKVFVEGILLGINSFDQFGVELGKSLAKKYMSDLYSNSLFSRKNSNLSKDLLRQLFKDKNG